MKYRYCRSYGHGNAITIEPIPSTGPKALTFRTQIWRIAVELFGEGASLNSVVTGSAGGVLFQLQDLEENKRKAKMVTKIWRERYRK